tara:strand:+ start:268 stop:495 length:228 start_codon:yes stop_codon:yes gene_type:complete
MARINLIPCTSKFENKGNVDNVEILIDDKNFLAIYKVHGHTVDNKRWEKIHIEHMKQRDDCETWESISQTEYIIR